MRTLYKNGKIINVFTETITVGSVLVENCEIVGVGDYSDKEADVVYDCEGKYISPGFIDAHMHIESTMLTPARFSEIAILHGTTAVVADPHEIANVCGVNGIKYMLDTSKELPLSIFYMLPSCVPSTVHDEAGAVLGAKELEPLYQYDSVLGLAEMMNYPGVVFEDPAVLDKLSYARKNKYIIDGHAPLLLGKDLDKYISKGVKTDHECSTLEEAYEKIEKGMFVLIREGSAAKNLASLVPLLKGATKERCAFATDDCTPFHITRNGHIDNIVRLAIKEHNIDPIIAIKTATINPSMLYSLHKYGAIAPGYYANMLLLDDLENLTINSVIYMGKKVVANNKLLEKVVPRKSIYHDEVLNSFNRTTLTNEDFYIEKKSDKCRVISMIKNQLISTEMITDIDFSKNNGVDTKKDIIKLAVIERHDNTGHIGLGFLHGLQIKRGAMASSISHDNHNLIVVGVSESDMKVAANAVLEAKGGNAIVIDGEVVSLQKLPVAGLMSEEPVESVVKANMEFDDAAYKMGIPKEIDPRMCTSFVSLSVIPSLKMTTKGLIQVETQTLLDLFVE